MSERTFLTGLLWFLSALVLGALFISAGLQGELTAGHLGFASVLLCLVAIATPLLLRLKDDEAKVVKSKRRRIDHMLRDMNDEELVELKQRLSTDDTVLDYLSGDGELVGTERARK
jgi:hypothetical protein